MASCTIIVAILCVLITTIALIITYATPNWVRFDKNASALCSCTDCDCGMWLTCKGGFLSDGSVDNCRWFFSNDFEVLKKLPDWFKVVQGLMSCAVASSLLSLIVGLFSLCCYCKNCNPHQATATFVSITFLLVAAAVCVFAAKGHIDHNIVILTVDDPGEPMAVFGWSFWVAVGAGVMAFIASTLFFCVGRSQEEYV